MCIVLICLILLCRNSRLLLWILFVSYPTINMIWIIWWGISLWIKFPYPRIANNLIPIPIPISIPINLYSPTVVLFPFPWDFHRSLWSRENSHHVFTCTGEECWFWHNVYISQTMPLSLWCINFCVYSLINVAFVTIVQRHRSLMNIQRLLAMNIVSVTVKCDCQLLWLCCCSL